MWRTLRWDFDPFCPRFSQQRLMPFVFPRCSCSSQAPTSLPPQIDVYRRATQGPEVLKIGILYESHVPPDDKNQDLIRVASPLITPSSPPITLTNHLKQAPRTHAASANHSRQTHEPHRGQMHGQKCAQKEGAQIAFHPRGLSANRF